MTVHAYAHPMAEPAAFRRLNAITPQDDAARHALADAIAQAKRLSPRHDLIREGRPIGQPMLVLEGWAARVRLLSDGRRQILGLVLPGDTVGDAGYAGAVATTTIAAFTPMMLCPLPDAARSPTLARAYAISRAIDEAYLMAQITRLGRLNAYERIVDFLLEIWERLSLAGLEEDDGFTMPLTQETLADVLGLTAVHINRMLQQARRAGDLAWSGGRVTLHEPAALARTIGRPRDRILPGLALA